MFDLTEDERFGILEAVDRGIDERLAYLSNGNPRFDYDEEWPDSARDQAKRWRNCSSALRKMDVITKADCCDRLAACLEASAKEYEEDNQ